MFSWFKKEKEVCQVEHLIELYQNVHTTRFDPFRNVWLIDRPKAKSVIINDGDKIYKKETI